MQDLFGEIHTAVRFTEKKIFFPLVRASGCLEYKLGGVGDGISIFLGLGLGGEKEKKGTQYPPFIHSEYKRRKRIKMEKKK